MCATHLLIMLYLSVKFHQICFSSLKAIAETRFVTDGLTDGRCDFNMPSEVPFCVLFLRFEKLRPLSKMHCSILMFKVVEWCGGAGASY